MAHRTRPHLPAATQIWPTCAGINGAVARIDVNSRRALRTRPSGSPPARGALIGVTMHEWLGARFRAPAQSSFAAGALAWCGAVPDRGLAGPAGCGARRVRSVSAPRSEPDLVGARSCGRVRPSPEPESVVANFRTSRCTDGRARRRRRSARASARRSTKDVTPPRSSSKGRARAGAGATAAAIGAAGRRAQQPFGHAGERRADDRASAGIGRHLRPSGAAGAAPLRRLTDRRLRGGPAVGNRRRADDVPGGGVISKAQRPTTTPLTSRSASTALPCWSRRTTAVT